jgi:hypothetical protein
MRLAISFDRANNLRYAALPPSRDRQGSRSVNDTVIGFSGRTPGDSEPAHAAVGLIFALDLVQQVPFPLTVAQSFAPFENDDQHGKEHCYFKQQPSQPQNVGHCSTTPVPDPILLFTRARRTRARHCRLPANRRTGLRPLSAAGWHAQWFAP